MKSRGGSERGQLVRVGVQSRFAQDCFLPVQGSTNLFDWESLTTNTSPFSFKDTDITNFPLRFYRAIYLP